ncbi:phage tail length tape measure family protein [uncultured Roseovarius sp.]|uniref:phage tail length tape measure family protein n=1 Tax=uncultured Roseovarius sp. TaxID=293344 RepID=UPI0026163431|nr:phage tail length tape measure family protein [uncultured Roseovarius sp.]
MTFRVQGEILMDAEQAKAQLKATGTAAKATSRDLRTLGAAGTDIERSMGLVTRGLNSAEDSAQAMSAEMDQLRARFDPMFALSQRYEAELSELNRAHRLGALTAGQYDTALDRLNNDFARHATGAQGMATANRAAAASNRAVAASNRLAAGSMGNLVAQGNDVITMLAAGQNPLQLALQQGTQITQEIGPLGAAGAFRALGGAILSMLSPINLITIGAIAATAAVVNWFNSGTDEAQSFAEGVDELGNSVDSLRERIEDASRTRVELAEEFGDSFVDRAQDLLDRIVEAEQRFAGRQATATITSFLDETDVDLQSVIAARNPALPSSAMDAGFADNARDQLARQFELAEGLFGRFTGQNRQLVQEVLNDLADLSLAAEGTLEEQQAALAALIQSYDRAAVASGRRSPAEDENLRLLQEQELELARVIELQKQDPAENRRTEEMLSFLATVTESTEEQLRANAAMRDMLATQQEQNAIAQAIARHGADSAEVTRLRAQFARDAKLEEIEASEASEELKKKAREAAQAFFEISTTDLTGPISAAADEAARLSAEVRGAVGALIELQNSDEFNLARARINAEFRDDPIARAGELRALEFDRDAAPIREGGFENPGEEVFLNSQRQAAIERAREIARLNQQSRPTRSGRGGTRRSSADAVDRERQNIDRLIATKQREIEALRESDPVQREMIRLREQLTAATPKQREEIEATIEAHEAERAAMERKAEFEDTLNDVLLDARSLRDIWDGIGDAVIRAAKEALLLGQGPLAGLFGGGGSGGGTGLLGGLFGGIGDVTELFSGGSLLSFADGGLPAARLLALAGGGDPRESRPGIVLGSGTARSDSILAKIGAGEFIMTGEATARNRPVLEAMNAGAVIPGFAGGGLPLPRQSFDARPGAGPRGGGRDGGMTRLRVEPSDLFRIVAEETARDVALDVVDNFATQQLPQRVESINRDPRGRG